MKPKPVKKAVVKKAKKSNAQNLCSMLKKQIAEMNKLKFKYSNRNNARTWAGANKKK